MIDFLEKLPRHRDDPNGEPDRLLQTFVSQLLIFVYMPLKSLLGSCRVRAINTAKVWALFPMRVGGSLPQLFPNGLMVSDQEQ